MWLVAGIVVCSFLLHAGVIWLGGRPLAQRSNSMMSDRTMLVREVLTLTPPGQRDEAAARLSHGPIKVARASAFPSGPGSGDGAVDFAFALDGVPWKISYALHPPGVGFLAPWLIWLVVLAIALFSSLAFGTLSVTRPIARLTEQIASQGSHLRPIPTPPRAPLELVELVRSFNGLADAVAQADETKQQMLAGVSHDLRGPLSRLRLRIETQCEPPVSTNLQADVEVIERIVSQFLAYVEGETRGVIGELEPVVPVISHLLNGYFAQGRDVRAMLQEVDLRLPDIMLHRLLCNLIDNALKHGLEPVEVELAQDSQGRVRLTVWDFGRGMNEADFQRAQQPFIRFVADTSAAGGGCGLGLSIVARIASQLGAQLEVRSDWCGRFGVSLLLPDNAGN